MLTLEPIGHIQSCWPEKFGTPRQGSVVPSSTAELVLAPGALDGAASADGLAAFSHVWLVWHVHPNEGSAPSAKVQAPHLRGGKAGVFATRSPFRPNPLGLSLAKLERVDGALEGGRLTAAFAVALADALERHRGSLDLEGLTATNATSPPPPPRP